MEFFATLHPKIVHFPIVFFFSYVLLDASGLIIRKYNISHIALGALILGILSSVFTLISGEQAARMAELKGQFDSNPRLTEFYSKLITRHETYATYSVWLFSLLCVLKLHLFIRTKIKNQVVKRLHFINISTLLIALLGAYLIYLTGETGGALVYKYGIGTDLFTRDSTFLVP